MSSRGWSGKQQTKYRERGGVGRMAGEGEGEPG